MMKNLSWFDKLLFFLNSIFSAALLFSYLLPYIPPEKFALLSVLSLGVPLLIMLNLAFLIYWFIRIKKQAFLPFLVLLLGINHLTSIYEVSTSEDVEADFRKLKVLSYNVKQFNQFRWTEEKNIPQKVSAFIAKKDPEVVAMQEYFVGELDIAASFPHKYIKIIAESAEFGLAILSKYPIINSGSLDFPSRTNNNAIFADIVIQEDTLRFINVHLQSYGTKPVIDSIDEKKHAKKVFLGMGRTFVQQEQQMELVLQVMQESPYKVVVLGDFNNTAYSYIYRKLKSEGLEDAYKEAGNGFGRTFDFDYFPLRIDFILVEEVLDITAFETFEVPYSDHFPIMANIRL